ncbi:MAG: YolD-like family protein [Clostridia bacterium]|nr:YolD-like family protein [Clostridia bacterium]
MNREDRAKQFLSFDALSGLRQELKRREEKRLMIEKKEVPEETAMEISNKLAVIDKGEEVEITFYYKGVYVTASGVVTAKNTAFKYLSLNGAKIAFDDVYDLTIKKTK